MKHLTLTLDACQARIDHLRQVVASEPEFANWNTAEVLPNTYLVQLWPMKVLSPSEAVASAKRIARAIGGEWIDRGDGKWENTSGRFILYVDPELVFSGRSEVAPVVRNPLEDDSDLVAPLVMNR